ncbi:MAG: preprotein translocase subunit YajC [Rickettsiaceae bacterium]|nr:preprotein translocase subunit YajC [Rickettsiaceae bacterium]
MSLNTLTNSSNNRQATNSTVSTTQTEKTTGSEYYGIDTAFTSMVPLVLIMVIFYFFLLRPQEQKRKELEEMVQSVKKGEEVITSSGIFGKITKSQDKDSFVLLEIAENTNIKILKSAIVEIITRSSQSDKKK